MEKARAELLFPVALAHATRCMNECEKFCLDFLRVVMADVRLKLDNQHAYVVSVTDVRRCFDDVVSSYTRPYSNALHRNFTSLYAAVSSLSDAWHGAQQASQAVSRTEAWVKQAVQDVARVYAERNTCIHAFIAGKNAEIKDLARALQRLQLSLNTASAELDDKSKAAAALQRDLANERHSSELLRAELELARANEADAQKQLAQVRADHAHLLAAYKSECDRAAERSGAAEALKAQLAHVETCTAHELHVLRAECDWLTQECDLLRSVERRFARAEERCAANVQEGMHDAELAHRSLYASCDTQPNTAHQDVEDTHHLCWSVVCRDASWCGDGDVTQQLLAALREERSRQSAADDVRAALEKSQAAAAEHERRTKECQELLRKTRQELFESRSTASRFKDEYEAERRQMQAQQRELETKVADLDALVVAVKAQKSALEQQTCDLEARMQEAGSKERDAEAAEAHAGGQLSVLGVL
eukprot:CAMPEP_0196658226 /NCGR_PEP_ID=MMETSP1086-20130531/28174_1 /TAXON_ID=77921 /ORGANISM="Cyanoptyche  gloeocystis , Strain SAG4.97" /LENGTH=475 /DNA_ID=CAMNT_0041991695 /DNA_START=146 /DNA_END=1572 /DNA_ORIENTATION=+